MKNQFKKEIRDRINVLFFIIKNHRYYRDTMTLPFIVRLFIAIILIIYGVIAILSPLPLGAVCLIL